MFLKFLFSPNATFPLIQLLLNCPSRDIAKNQRKICITKCKAINCIQIEQETRIKFDRELPIRLVGLLLGKTQIYWGHTSRAASVVCRDRESAMELFMNGNWFWFKLKLIACFCVGAAARRSTAYMERLWNDIETSSWPSLYRLYSSCTSRSLPPKKSNHIALTVRS